MMDGALERATAVVAKHRGKVLQYAGDNILAAFGADEAREDDAERAVRCGLALLELGKVLGAEVRAAHGHAGFDVRVGIHTGGVLLGGGVDAEGSIRGIAVNIAARMEQTAPAGALRISHDTYAQVRGLFEVERRSRWRSRASTSRSRATWCCAPSRARFRIGSRGIEGVATRMIGRDAELEALQDAFKRLFVDRKLAAVTVVADAGIGKSRLLYEFAGLERRAPGELRPLPRPRHAADARPAVRTAARHHRLALPDRRRRQHRGGAPEDGAGHRPAVPGRRRSRPGGRPCPSARPPDRHRLARRAATSRASSTTPSRSATAPSTRRRSCSAASALPTASPVVLQLEDLHWADDESLDFLDLPGRGRPRRAAVDAGLRRPTLFERSGELVRGEASTGGSTCSRSART